MRHQEQVQRYNAPHIAPPSTRLPQVPAADGPRLPSALRRGGRGRDRPGLRAGQRPPWTVCSGPGRATSAACSSVPGPGSTTTGATCWARPTSTCGSCRRSYSDEQRVGFVEKVEQTSIPGGVPAPRARRLAGGRRRRRAGLPGDAEAVPRAALRCCSRTAGWRRSRGPRRTSGRRGFAGPARSSTTSWTRSPAPGTGGPTAAPTASSRTTRSSRRPRRPRSLHRAPAHRSPPASATPAGRGPDARCGDWAASAPAHPSSLTPARPAFPTPLRGPVRLPFLLTGAAAALLLVAGCSPATEDDRGWAERTERTERVALQVLPGIAQPGTGTAGSPELSLLSGPGRARATRCAAAAAAGAPAGWRFVDRQPQDRTGAATFPGPPGRGTRGVTG